MISRDRKPLEVISSKLNHCIHLGFLHITFNFPRSTDENSKKEIKIIALN